MSNKPKEQTIEVWARLIRAQITLLDKVHDGLKQAGLPVLAWYDVLLELHRVGEAGLRQFEIVDKLLLPKHNLSRLLDRLENESLVSRRRSDLDGRGQVVHITDHGTELLRKMWPVYGRVIRKEFEAKLTSEEISALGKILSKLLV
ncbi:MAG: MarR family transcriptional regulator [Pseudomonadota bacterium]|nr:MarR family transcriptional regulator [Pseudomonadota bacterium]